MSSTEHTPRVLFIGDPAVLEEVARWVAACGFDTTQTIDV